MTATVQALYRYPVKSFQGLPVAQLDVGASGVAGDRRWALVADEGQHVLSAKRHAELLGAEVAEVGDGLVLRLPDGTTHRVGDPKLDAALSAWVGRDVRLQEAGAEAAPSYEMTFDPPDDAADLYDIPVPAGTFLDLSPVHLLTTASLARCAEAAPDTSWDVRRFRPNVLVATDDGGFPEDAWVGGRLRIGDVELAVAQQTVRCAMPLRAQPGGIERDVDVYRTLDRVHANHLGVYCDVATTGTIRVGDPVAPVG